jgi:long-chain acyl-CoA synthetase
MDTLRTDSATPRPAGSPERPWHRFYEDGVPTTVAYDERSVAGNLFASAATVPDRAALIFENSRLSYRQLDDSVRRFATSLAKLGVARGTRVAIYLPNLPQTVIAYYAALALGADVVMTNPQYVEREIVSQWTDANVEVAVVADWLFEQKVRHVRGDLPVRHFVTTGIADFLRAPLRWLAGIKMRRAGMAAAVAPGPGIHDFRELLEAEPMASFVEPDLDSVALLQYTGGTTGISKGAMLTHRNLACNVQQTVAWFPSLLPGEEVWLACLPYFHIFGMTIAMNWPVRVGGTIVLMPNPRDVPKMIKLIAKHRVSVFPAVPALFNAIVNHPASKKADLTAVKGCFSGSAPLPVAILEAFEALTGGKISEGFGLSETSPVTHCNPLRGKRKTGSIGIPIPDTDAKIVDTVTGERELAVGDEGELILKGPQVMAGYWKKPDETALTLRDGWLFTGDLARMDEEGYFWICGRKKDLILASGYKIFPDEIDRVLMSHPKILEAATIGIPDPKRGETVKSFVVMKPGEVAAEEEILAFCREQLAAFKIPKQLEFRTELPKSALQKILRRELKDEEMRKAAAAPPAPR